VRASTKGKICQFMVIVIATRKKLYNTTKFFKNITIEIILKNLPHHAGLQTSTYYSRPIPPHHRKKVGSFWWHDIMSIFYHFFMMVTCTTHEGKTVYFWSDTRNPRALQWKLPQLYSFALNKNRSAKAFRNGDIQRHF
jgi:hypothetical protein